ncbi:sulfotransferase family protein [Microbulbifer aggregans]|uniref:sulfotransferase family protein n=1 Tax=Microbulbifer aggregans TaxID=1769779 RepID=UPI001CFE602C|nr:sulfotransferase [Microbulbifer aggregans]
MENKKLPNFFVVGAMKAGTTSLYQMLDSHPNVYLSYPKEPEYFSEKYLEKDSESWYLSLFAESPPNSLRGDCSTGYSRRIAYPGVAERIFKSIPSAQIVYLLRHPVERCWSHYLHRMNERVMDGECILDFDNAVEIYPEILDTSCYFSQVDNFTQFFDRSQIHVIIFDDLRESAEATMTELYDFLNLPRVPVYSLTHANKSGDQTGRRNIKAFIKRVKSSTAGKLLKVVVPRTILNSAAKFISKNKLAIYAAKSSGKTADLPKKPSPELRAKLLLYFKKETLQLENWVGRSLPPSWYS